jgi:catechol 2,3-dioxygenase-like lactoylglutathione lyase family enzyme
MAQQWSGWIPILKVVDAQRSVSFYCDVLGFDKDWEHRFAEGWPLYLSVSRGALTLHLSEHHDGDTGGTALFVPVDDVDAVYAELVGSGSCRGISAR